ncbi:MAG: phosphogluconate dehydrogenase C-terminal domain-containing protein [Dehalococcoidales bacterium]|nr:phosphogluconate dehydrogenase C-terminal domain-containing protein [Dehalococcoidales bacterium]MDP6824809.1 phosphogluconate dehydrogenase C-terminal domain-containing protein [Dehalococcoidales bacterium]|tara:strand:- start:525 stop:1370 length:846 start_codon:yes stop_codon:yes gene_type:complete
MSTIALMGAGGKMGQRLTRNLKDNPDYKTLYVEISESGQASLTKLGLVVTPQVEALAQADVVILAVPDALIGRICREIVLGLKSGTMVIGLDPAAGFAGILPEREDITYFITHPCHPPIFGSETDPEAQRDWFGSDKAKQSIVCSLHHGPEKDYARGEAIARAIYAPVMKAHRLNTEQMAILEPALVETLALTCITICREAVDEVVRMGLPEPAVRDFFFGHLRTTTAIVFDMTGFPVSDGARLAVSEARNQIFQPDWKKILKIENVKKSVQKITHATAKD